MSEPDRSPSYFAQSRRPIHSLILVAPFLLVYEIGVLALQLATPDFQTRNAADVLIHEAARASLGISALFLGVLVLAVAWVIWQWRVKASLRYDLRTVSVMCGESALFALALYIIPWQLYAYLLRGMTLSAADGAGAGLWGNIVLSCGAGVYEEFVFRVLLVALLAGICLKVFKMERTRAGIIAVLVGALIFSSAHHQGPHGDPVDVGSVAFWLVFTFRTVAGVYFAALYYFRCFGVAVATHAIYNILVVLDQALRGA